MYIRTNDGVYLKIRECDENNKILIVGKTITDFGTYIEKKDIITQSENLEELCDRFVYFDITHRTHIVCSLEEYKRYKQDKYWTCDLHIWYGAIWVQGKGLIYVAKMNENGELCLL